MASRNENTCICSFQGDFSVLLPLSNSQASPRSRCRPPLFLLFSLFFFCSCLPQQASRIPSHLQPKSSAFSPLSLPAVLGWIKKAEKKQKKRKIHEKIKKPPPQLRGSTNMPIFDRVHECKEYEYWNEKKV